MSDAEVFIVADHVQASKKQKGFKELQTTSGLTLQENGLLWDREIREILPPSKAIFDPMHVYFSGGIFGSEARNLFTVINGLHKKGQLEVSSQSFVEFAASADWLTPRKPSVHQSCPSTRRVAAGLIVKDKASASQALQMYPLLDCWVKVALGSTTNEDLMPKVQSFLKLCAVVRAVRRAKETPVQDEAHILNLQQESLRLFGLAWGKNKARPKHHYQFHLGSQCVRWNAMLDCWAMERKHRDFKAAANKTTTNKIFATSVLKQLLQHEMEVMAQKGYVNGLHKTTLNMEGKLYHPGDCILFLSGAPMVFVISGFEKDARCNAVSVHGETWQLALKLQADCV